VPFRLTEVLFKLNVVLFRLTKKIFRLICRLTGVGGAGASWLEYLNPE